MIQKSKIYLVLLATTIAASSSAWSKDAGCGLGSLVIQRNTKVSQTLAVTTNGTLLTQLFGITSGTSGCSASNLVWNEQQAVKYAEANYESLKIETARGEGANLVAFGSLMGCSDSQQFAVSAREQFGELFPESGMSPSQLVETAKTRVATNCKI